MSIINSSQILQGIRVAGGTTFPSLDETQKVPRSLPSKAIVLICEASDDDIVDGLIEMYNDHCAPMLVSTRPVKPNPFYKAVSGVGVTSSGVRVAPSFLNGSMIRFYGDNDVCVDPETMLRTVVDIDVDIGDVGDKASYSKMRFKAEMKNLLIL